MLLTERSASTISGSIRLREFRAFLIHRVVMFARNFKKARTAEPELDEKSLASLAICSSPPSGLSQSSGDLTK